MQLITVTLDDKTSQALDRWLAKTAAATGPPRLTAEEAIPAMVPGVPGLHRHQQLGSQPYPRRTGRGKLDTCQSRQGPGAFYLAKSLGHCARAFGVGVVRQDARHPAGDDYPAQVAWFSAYSIASSLGSRVTEQGEVAPVEPHPSGPAPPHRRNGCYPEPRSGCLRCSRGGCFVCFSLCAGRIT